MICLFTLLKLALVLCCASGLIFMIASTVLVSIFIISGNISVQIISDKKEDKKDGCERQ